METEQSLLVEKKDKAVILRLNRPRVMNCIDFKLLHTLCDTVDELYYEKDIRAVIFTGAGDKAFTAGADLKERATYTPEEVNRYVLTIRNLLTAIQNLPFAVICAVNGIALGGGTEIALASDIRLASENASMGLTETRLAVIPGAGGTQRMPRIIGIAKAKELIFTGRRVDAREALEIGLVNKIVPLENLMDEAMKIVAQICETGPIAVEMAKYAIDKGMGTDLATGLAIESNAYRVTIPTKDRLEGLAAFREKRKPDFKGH